MTAIEQCIEEAVEKGGWKPQGEEIGAYKLEYDDELSFQIERRENGYNCRRMSTYEIFLDPSFWQALSKARGWGRSSFKQSVPARVNRWRKDGTRSSVPALIRMQHRLTPKRWKKEWHRFIDHLAEGKDAESFFPTLTS